MIAAALGSASVGVDASSLSTETFDSTNALVADTFGASASTGMTYPKLVEAWRIMRHRQVDLDAERPCVIMGSLQESDLKKQQEVISKDYNERPVIENGRVESLAGFDIIVSERNTYTLAGAGALTTPTLNGPLELLPPFDGDCVAKPVTRATFLAQVVLLRNPEVPDPRLLIP